MGKPEHISGITKRVIKKIEKKMIAKEGEKSNEKAGHTTITT